MSSGNSPVLSRKTYFRSIEPVIKIGYMDGVSDGQNSVYQKCFDIGYEQGYKFGLSLGFNEAFVRLKEKQNTLSETLLDPRKINCQVCLKRNGNEENNISCINNNQEEKNLVVLSSSN